MNQYYISCKIESSTKSSGVSLLKILSDQQYINFSTFIHSVDILLVKFLQGFKINQVALSCLDKPWPKSNSIQILHRGSVARASDAILSSANQATLTFGIFCVTFR